jgi:hypothetical protein
MLSCRKKGRSCGVQRPLQRHDCRQHPGILATENYGSGQRRSTSGIQNLNTDILTDGLLANKAAPVYEAPNIPAHVIGTPKDTHATVTSPRDSNRQEVPC